MKSRSFSTMGSLHPVLFFAAMYVVALLFAIFICSSLFYSCNAKPASLGEQKTSPASELLSASNTVALR